MSVNGLQAEKEDPVLTKITELTRPARCSPLSGFFPDTGIFHFHGATWPRRCFHLFSETRRTFPLEVIIGSSS